MYSSLLLIVYFDDNIWQKINKNSAFICSQYSLGCWTDSRFLDNQDIQELLALWKPHFAMASCIFLYAPSNNRQLFYDGEKPYFFCQDRAIKNIPLTVRRPTLKEARRIYSLLVQVSPEIIEETTPGTKEESLSSIKSGNHSYTESSGLKLKGDSEGTKVAEASSIITQMDGLSVSVKSRDEINAVGISTPFHEAAKSGSVQKVLELLEQGLDPCVKDERGQTPYMLASDKEVRNTFRRFMASNMEKWDWHAAKVPSPLTKEMEESQAAKQVKSFFANLHLILFQFHNSIKSNFPYTCAYC